jgi:quinol monooxygenase YgiN
MIHVVAEIELKPGCREEYLKLFKAHVVKVRAEVGCVAYAPTIDAAGAPMAAHPPRENVVTILEQWQTLADLQAHAQAPHQLAFRKQVGHLMSRGRVEVFQEA